MCYIYLLSKSISDQIIDIFAFSMFFVERRSQGLYAKYVYLFLDRECHTNTTLGHSKFFLCPRTDWFLKKMLK